MTLFKKSKQTFGLAAAATAFALTTPDADAQRNRPGTPRPNIVLMLADDQGYGDASFMGATKLQTPRMDQLAREGVIFSDAHSGSAVCQPTRYGILTGRGYWRAERPQGTYFIENEIMLPQVLKDNGYNTAMFGKWHLGFVREHDVEGEHDWNGRWAKGPNWIGFDYFFGMANSHAQPPFVFLENEHIYQHDPADPIIPLENREQEWLYTWDSGGSTGAAAAHEACDMDRLDLILAERADQWMGEQTQDTPFFLFMSFFAPHVPFTIAEEFRGTSEAGELGDYMHQLDYATGMVLDALEKHGFADNTLVIYTSDNGGVYILGEPHGEMGSLELGHRSMGELLGLKTDTWEGGHRVPFIARWPGKIPAGTQSDQLLALEDLFATFAAAANITLPRNAAPDSYNQLPLLLNPEVPIPIRTEMIYAGRGRALRHGDWVYLPDRGSGGLFGTFYLERFGYEHSDFDGNVMREDAPPAQLYNLRDDIAQSRNLYYEEPEMAAFMAARFEEVMRQRKSR